MGFDPTPAPGGSTQTTHHLEHILAIALPLTVHTMDLAKRYVSGDGGWWSSGGKGTSRGVRHQTLNRSTVRGGDPPVVHSDTFHASILHACTIIGSRKRDAQMAETKMAETVAPTEQNCHTSSCFQHERLPRRVSSASQWLFRPRSSRPTRAPCFKRIGRERSTRELVHERQEPALLIVRTMQTYNGPSAKIQP